MESGPVTVAPANRVPSTTARSATVRGAPGTSVNASSSAAKPGASIRTPHATRSVATVNIKRSDPAIRCAGVGGGWGAGGGQGGGEAEGGGFEGWAGREVGGLGEELAARAQRRDDGVVRRRA